MPICFQRKSNYSQCINPYFNPFLFPNAFNTLRQKKFKLIDYTDNCTKRDIVMNPLKSTTKQINKERMNFYLINNALKSEYTLHNLFSELYKSNKMYYKEDPGRMQID